MIFDKNYDASLWSILKANRKGRKELSSFIKEIPEPLLNNIRKAIELFKNNEFKFDAQTSDFFRCISSNDPKIYFYFQLDNDGCLTITKEYFDGQNSDELFELMIYPLNLEEIKKMAVLDDEWLGTVTTNIQTTHISESVGLVDCNESEYNIIRTPVGFFVQYEIELDDREKIGYKPIILKLLPKDLNKKNL